MLVFYFGMNLDLHYNLRLKLQFSLSSNYHSPQPPHAQLIYQVSCVAPVMESTASTNLDMGQLEEMR